MNLLLSFLFLIELFSLISSSFSESYFKLFDDTEIFGFYIFVIPISSNISLGSKSDIFELGDTPLLFERIFSYLLSINLILF